MIEFLKLFVLLYADDTIIVAENAHDLQNAPKIQFQLNNISLLWPIHQFTIDIKFGIFVVYIRT